jgi:outer membrane lipoprotein SlyB
VPQSEDGLARLIDRLVAMKLISKKDATVLKKLVSNIVNAKDIDALAKRVSESLKALSDEVGEVAQAIIRIANDSIQYVIRVLRGIDIKLVIHVVSADVMGALTGAGAGGQLGGLPAAVIGALIGAVSGSAYVAFDPKR